MSIPSWRAPNATCSAARSLELAQARRSVHDRGLAGIIATTMVNAYYDSHETYVFALRREMRNEYEIIVSAASCCSSMRPTSAMERARHVPGQRRGRIPARPRKSTSRPSTAPPRHPARALRLHCCWGNWEGPHTHDVPLATLLPLLYRAKVGALSIEFANPRHQHEYAALRENPLPPDVILISRRDRLRRRISSSIRKSSPTASAKRSRPSAIAAG